MLRRCWPGSILKGWIFSVCLARTFCRYKLDNRFAKSDAEVMLCQAQFMFFFFAIMGWPKNSLRLLAFFCQAWPVHRRPPLGHWSYWRRWSLAPGWCSGSRQCQGAGGPMEGVLRQPGPVPTISFGSGSTGRGPGVESWTWDEDVGKSAVDGAVCS